MLLRHRFVLAVALSLGLAPAATAADLPEGFVYLSEIDASIIQDMRLAGPHNFIGRPVVGYDANECILTVAAAQALKSVQNRLEPDGLSLKVYDCYRPARAADRIARWAASPDDRDAEAEFYPLTDKAALAGHPDIFAPSAHSRGSAIDVAIVILPVAAEPPWRRGDPMRACHLPKVQRFADNSLDFGTGFSCFHPASRSASAEIAPRARQNRNLLVLQMARSGFVNAPGAWWHFELEKEPFPGRTFDFPVEPAPPGPARGAKEERELRLSAACLFKGETLEVQSAPGRGRKVIARLAPDATGLQPIRCEGNITLIDWFSLDAIARQTVFAPWCLVRAPSAAGTSPVEGWVSADFLVDATAAVAPPCRQR